MNGWQLAKGTKFEKVEKLLYGLKNRFIRQGSVAEIIFIDNCCHWRAKLQSIFPAIIVKLDIFHAIQRIVKTIPKKKGSKELRGVRRTMIKSLKHFVRKPNDRGADRMLDTASPEEIEQNLNEFIQQWNNVEADGVRVLPEEAISAIGNLKEHVTKGCLSGVPPHAGTNRNESLHRILNKEKKGRIGVELAVATLGLFFYRWNEQRCTNSTFIRPIEYHTDPSDDVMPEAFGISNSLLSRHSTLEDANQDGVEMYDSVIAADDSQVHSSDEDSGK